MFYSWFDMVKYHCIRFFGRFVVAVLMVAIFAIIIVLS
jgi:hypothetical protein